MNKLHKNIFLFLIVASCILLISNISFASEDIKTIDTTNTDIQKYTQNIEDNEYKIIEKDEKYTKNSQTTAKDFEDFATQTQPKEDKIINLDKKTYAVTKNLSVNTPYNLTINGNGAIFDGKNTYKFLDFSGKTLTLKNLTLINMNCGNTGALSISASSNAIIENCKFINNTGDNRGVIINRMNLTIKNCTFENNKGFQGSSIFSTGNNGYVNITNSVFKNNPVKQEKEPVLFFSNPQKVTIDNCTFENNTGRSIHNYLKTDVTVKNSKFININNKYTSTIQGVIIDNYEGDLKLYNNTFNNITLTAPRIGGGILYQEIETLEIINNTFNNIKLNSTGSTDRIAGGIVWTRNSTTTVKNNTFNAQLTAYNIHGGLLYNNIGNLTVTNNTFNEKITASKEIAGGAIYNDYDPDLNRGGNLTYGDNDFTNITSANKNANIINITIRNKGNIKLIGSENKVRNKTATVTITGPKNIDTGKKVTFNITAFDNKTPINATAIVKINGLTLKENNNNILVNILNGHGNLTYQLAGYSGREYTVTVVLSKKGYDRAENTTKLVINKGTYQDISLDINATSEEKITINKTLKDTNGNLIYGTTQIAIKLGDRTVLTTKVIDGKLNAQIQVPYLPAGTNKLKIILGENYRYNVKIINKTININKQDVTVTINNITSKAGKTIQLTAKLINSKTKTNVISGKYIFKVNQKTVPFIINNKEVYTTGNINNAIATCNYKIPNDMKEGTYTITLVYNGNTQSNSVRYESKSLTITN